MPQVVEGARAGLPARCEAVAGDFFASAPQGGDAYILKHIVHDWDDEQAAAILRSCRHAMMSNARLLVIEMVIPPGNDPHFGKLLDVEMLAVTGGLERTDDEFAESFESAGFELTQVIPTRSAVSIIEGRPV